MTLSGRIFRGTSGISTHSQVLNRSKNMSILTITSILLLFALKSISVDAMVPRNQNFDDQIDQYVRRVSIAGQSYRSKIANQVKIFTDEEPIAWEKSLAKVSNYGIPEIVFNGSNVELKPVIKINDITCREFLRELSNKPVQRCKQFQTHSMHVDSMKIEEMAKNVLTYLENVRHYICENRNMGVEKIEEISEVFESVKNSMSAVLIRAEYKAKNFVGDLSYCLLTQDDLDESLFNKWHKAYSYYTEA